MHIYMYMHAYVYRYICAFMIWLDTLRRCSWDFLSVYRCAYTCICIWVCMYACICHWLRPHLVACLTNDSWKRTLACDRGIEVVLTVLTFFDWYCHSADRPSNKGWKQLFPVIKANNKIKSLFSVSRFLRPAETSRTFLVATDFLYQAWRTSSCFLDFVQRACCHTCASRWSGGQP